MTHQITTVIADPSSVDAAIESRFSARAFTSQPVPRETLEHILHVASRAPSGTNCQPWKVYVVTGEARDRIVRESCAAHDAMRDDATLAASRYADEYDYYPTQWVSPYIDRRRHNGWTLYGHLGIGKGDKDKMHAQHQRNFKFFDAPVGLFFMIDKVMGRGSLVDCGMFIQNVMIAARAQGLHTCPQAAWNGFVSIIRPIIGAPESEMMVCGMSLGHADASAHVNLYNTPREPVASFAHWVA